MMFGFMYSIPLTLLGWLPGSPFYLRPHTNTILLNQRPGTFFVWGFIVAHDHERDPDAD